MNRDYDIIIIGGGAAGIFAAIQCAEKNAKLKIAILEKSTKILSKVKISGGGRCNVTHACFDPNILVQYYPRGKKELLSAFYQFQPKDTINWFKSKKVELKTEADGRMFPVTDNSQTIIDCFCEALLAYKIPVIYNTKVDAINTKNDFEIITNTYTYTAKKILVATGGFNKLENYTFITQLGIAVEPPIPSLFTFNISHTALTQLQGISVPVSVKLLGSKFEESGALLITHWGVSGPVILKLSAWASHFLNKKNYTFEFIVNWLLDKKEAPLIQELNTFKQQESSKKINNALPFHLPQKLTLYLFEKAGISTALKWGDISKKQIQNLVQIVLNDHYLSEGKTTFKSEFVSCGGVKLNEINFKTFESKKIPKLYFAGEVLNIDALTGGFNFQAAWTSGFIAAQALAE